jgi:hypothetical protein
LNSNLVLSHRFLAELPGFVSFILIYGITTAVLWPMRLYFEGVAYNVAWSSKYGDAALTAVVVLAGLVLRYGKSEMPEWATGTTFHAACALIGVGVGIFMVFGPTPLWRSQVADNFHNFFTIGLFFYLLLVTAPVYYYQAPSWAVWLAVILMISWMGMAWDDVRTGRMDQRPYQIKQGVVFKN